MACSGWYRQYNWASGWNHDTTRCITNTLYRFAFYYLIILFKKFILEDRCNIICKNYSCSGGHKSKNFESLPHDLPLHTGFSGCIFDIELRTETAIYPITNSSPATGRGVGECHRNECIRHLCKNGAVCLNHGATYR